MAITADLHQQERGKEEVLKVAPVSAEAQLYQLTFDLEAAMRIRDLEEKRHNWRGDAFEEIIFGHLVFDHLDVYFGRVRDDFHIVRCVLLVALGYERGLERQEIAHVSRGMVSYSDTMRLEGR